MKQQKKALEKLEQGREGFSCSYFLLVFGAWCFHKYVRPAAAMLLLRSLMKKNHAETRDRAGDLQIFGLTLSQLSYRGPWYFNTPRLPLLRLHHDICGQQIICCHALALSRVAASLSTPRT